jgi:DNA-binding transcriptional ArsR family regulator
MAGMRTVDVLLHPVRMRIVQALLDGATMTAGQLRDELPEIPSASLYRHIATLADAGVLEVAQEKRVRGAVERGFRLHLPNAGVTAEDARRLSHDDHRRAFTAFCTMLMADFDRYLATPGADVVDDRVGFTQAALWLTDDELAELRNELAAAVTSRRANARKGTRKKYLIDTILMPAR